MRCIGAANAWPHPHGVGHDQHSSRMDVTGGLPAIGMLPSCLDGNIPICVANQAHLCRRKQLVDAASVKTDDDLVADDDRRSAAALVGPNQLLERRGVHRDIALDKVDPFLRKILFRAMAGASAVSCVYFDCIFRHLCFLHSVRLIPWVRIWCVEVSTLPAPTHRVYPRLACSS